MKNAPSTYGKHLDAPAGSEKLAITELEAWLEEEAAHAEYVKEKLYREAEDIDVKFLGDAEPFRYEAEAYRAVLQRIREGRP